MKEIEQNNNDRNGKVRNWIEMQSMLPEGIDNKDLKFLKGYFRIQKRIVNKQIKRAKELFHYLEKVYGYMEFEKDNVDLLKTVDIAVRGETRWE